MDDHFLTVAEVQNKLRISKSKTYRLIQQNKITVYRVGNTFRIRNSDLNKYLNQNQLK